MNAAAAAPETALTSLGDAPRFVPPLYRSSTGCSTVVDVDRLAPLDRALRFFSHNRFNLIAFHDRDYARPPRRPARLVERALASRGVGLDGGRIRVLTLRACSFRLNRSARTTASTPTARCARSSPSAQHLRRAALLPVVVRGAAMRWTDAHDKTSASTSRRSSSHRRYRFRLAQPGRTCASTSANSATMRRPHATLAGERRPLTMRCSARCCACRWQR